MYHLFWALLYRICTLANQDLYSEDAEGKQNRRRNKNLVADGVKKPEHYSIVETLTGMDNNNVSDEAAKSLLAKVQLKQPNSTVETSNIPVSQNQLQETSESEDSEEIEDVSTLLICFSAIFFSG